MNATTEFQQPPREFGVIPFWFWNDALDEAELIRQIDDFDQHGVHGFVIHPRVGLPRELGWMSDRLLDFYDLAIREAARRQMAVVLYDEGMYPSGSSSGQVVAANPAFACRGLVPRAVPPGEAPALAAGETLVALVTRCDGTPLAIIDRPVDSVIRGLHYRGEGPAEDEPPAADLLNPAATATFLRLVYDGFARRFAPHFGRTITAIFTDEPELLGRCRETGVMPGTTGILAHVNRLLGHNFTPHLPALWHDDEPDAARHRADYLRAVRLRLEETYYQPIAAWCEAHGLPLTGHPAKSDDLGVLRAFHIPGQDLVWRRILPDHPSALEGAESTQAKCAASAALHGRRRRNANECYGAYGHEFSWSEMNWLANWCFVRGTNLLYPHAFYYSMRGPRRDERPPDVGPHAPWWPRYRLYADACRRLCWLNTDSIHVCDIAILGRADWLPWHAARTCFRHQRDFNYVEARDLLDRATIDAAGVHIAGMTYRALILEHEPEALTRQAIAPLERSRRVIRCHPDTDDTELLAALDVCAPPEVRVFPATPALRIRHVRKAGTDWVIVFNEARDPVTVRLELASGGADGQRLDPATGLGQPWRRDQPLHLPAHALQVVATGP